jgi:hypothetical protein
VPIFSGARRRAARAQFYPPWGDPDPWDGGDPWGGGDMWGGWEPALPTCGYETVVCGSSPPGVPPPMCTIYCCRWPNGVNNCRII